MDISPLSWMIDFEEVKIQFEIKILTLNDQDYDDSKIRWVLKPSTSKTILYKSELKRRENSHWFHNSGSVYMYNDA